MIELIQQAGIFLFAADTPGAQPEPSLVDQVGQLIVGAIPTALLFIALVLCYQFLVQKPLTRTLNERRARTEGRHRGCPPGDRPGRGASGRVRQQAAPGSRRDLQDPRAAHQAVERGTRCGAGRGAQGGGRPGEPRQGRTGGRSRERQAGHPGLRRGSRQPGGARGSAAGCRGFALRIFSHFRCPAVISPGFEQSRCHSCHVSGHDFSRAASGPGLIRALAPEGSLWSRFAPSTEFFLGILRFAALTLLGAGLAAVPLRVAAQEQATPQAEAGRAAAGQAAPNSTPDLSAQPNQVKAEEREEENVYRHTPLVQKLARPLPPRRRNHGAALRVHKLRHHHAGHRDSSGQVSAQGDAQAVRSP